MITLNMTLLPGGSGIGRSSIITGSIWTTDCGKFHAYRIVQDNGFADDHTYTGQIAKTKSGHGNPFDLLINISQDIING